VVAAPDFEPSTVDVARVAVSPVPTFSKLELLIDEVESPSTLHVTVCPGIFVPFTVTLKFYVCPFSIEVDGITKTTRLWRSYGYV
jgi:hypothetical protein